MKLKKYAQLIILTNALLLTACATTSDVDSTAKVDEASIKKAQKPVVVVPESTVVSSNPMPKRARLKRLEKQPPRLVKRQVVKPETGVFSGSGVVNGGQENVTTSKPKAAARTVESPILRKMLRQADMAAANSEWSKAENYLERALRVEPRSAVVWQRLAEMKLAQDRPHQAIQFSRKAITLAKGDKVVIKRGWLVVEESNIRLNNPSKAAYARQKINGL